MGWSSKKRSLACLGALVFVVGCQKSDADALASIGGKIAARTHGYAAQLQQKCPNLPGSLESRVRSRLRWDKHLADSSVDVVVTDKNVELKGSLATPDQVRRAVDLAESTLGVDSVTNSLQVGP